MRTWPLRFAGTIVVLGAFLLAPSLVAAATGTLESKTVDPSPLRFPPTSPDWLYRLTSGQNVQMSAARRVVTEDGRTRVVMEPREDDPMQKAFAEIVKKQPEKYQSKVPFRGVVKLGDKRYAFVFDAVDSEARGYGVLYFDRNGDGDLTDDEMIESDAAKTYRKAKKEKEEQDKAEKEKAEKAKADEAADETTDAKKSDDEAKDESDEAKAKRAEAEKRKKAVEQRRRLLMNRLQSFYVVAFPRIDMKIEVEGQPVDYSFVFMCYAYSSEPFARLNAASYREGQIELDGKTRTIALVDYNCNGRFDDEMVVPPPEGAPSAAARLYAKPGDQLYVDPRSDVDYILAYDRTGPDFRHNVGKFLCLDGKCYDLKVAPAGDKITLEPSSVAVGHVTNPVARYAALVHGEKGVLKIQGTADAPAALPAGKWQLLSYLIDLTDAEKEKADETKAADEKETVPAIRTLRRSRSTYVAAMATADSPEIEVRENENVALPFGPPFKATVVPARFYRDTMSLALDITGSAKETVTGMSVKGNRPGKPKFKILDPEGKVVEEGAFEYG